MSALVLMFQDGGGIRGLSSLLILENIMEGIREAKGLTEVPKPCEYFHLIGGTSTGGYVLTLTNLKTVLLTKTKHCRIISIMLGRLGMTVDDCIRAYKKVAEQAFTPKPLKILPASPSGAFSAEQLELAIRKTIREHCTLPQCVELRGRQRVVPDACTHEEMDFRDHSCTKTYAPPSSLTRFYHFILPNIF